jgi:nucleoid DNA-binding protein
MSTSTDDVGPVPRDNILDYAELVETLAQQQKLPGSKIRSILRGLFALTAEGLKEGKAVRIRGLGVLRIREPAAEVAPRAERPVRNPGKRIVLSAEKALKVAVHL